MDFSTKGNASMNLFEYNSTSSTVKSLEEFLPLSLILTYNICVRYVSFFIWIVAFPSNLLIICILAKKKHGGHSTSVFFLSLALADLFVNFRTFNFWLVRSGLVTYTSDFECQIEKGYPLLGMLASSWTQAVVSVERTVSVCIPFRMKQICNVGVARVLVTVIWIMSLVVALLNASLHRIEENVCVVKEEYRNVFLKHIIYLDYTLDVVVPFFIILFNSVLTLSRVTSRKQSTSTQSKAFGKSITVLVLIINSVFFVTQVPYGIIFILQEINVHAETKVLLFYIEGITLVLKYVNYELNFYIYFLAASKFRKEAKEVFISCKQKCLTS